MKLKDGSREVEERNKRKAKHEYSTLAMQLVQYSISLLHYSSLLVSFLCKSHGVCTNIQFILSISI